MRVAPSGTVWEVQPDAPISNCVATIQMLHLPVIQRSGRGRGKGAGSNMQRKRKSLCRCTSWRTKPRLLFVLQKIKTECDIRRDPINISEQCYRVKMSSKRMDMED